MKNKVIYWEDDLSSGELGAEDKQNYASANVAKKRNI